MAYRLHKFCTVHTYNHGPAGYPFNLLWGAVQPAGWCKRRRYQSRASHCYWCFVTDWQWRWYKKERKSKQACTREAIAIVKIKAEMTWWQIHRKRWIAKSDKLFNLTIWCLSCLSKILVGNAFHLCIVCRSERAGRAMSLPHCMPMPYSHQYNNLGFPHGSVRCHQLL